MNVGSLSQIRKIYLFSAVPQAVKNLIQNISHIDKDVLIIDCKTVEVAAEIKELTWHKLLYLVGSAPSEEFGLRAVRYQWHELGQVQAWELPLYFTDASAMGAITRLDLSNTPVLTGAEILQEIYNHASETGLPACCLTMDESRPRFASDNIDRAIGICTRDFLDLPSTNICFPSFTDLATYNDRISQAKGVSIDLPVIATNVGGKELYHRWVRARLVRTSWGEMVRLVKVLELPRATGRFLEPDELFL